MQMNQSTTNQKPKEEELTDENFLSPEESELLLGSLELQDRNTIRSISPDPTDGEESFAQGDCPDIEDNPDLPIEARNPEAAGYRASQKSLAKIGAELRVLKAELVALKAHRFRGEADINPPAAPRIDYSTLVPLEPPEASSQLSKEFVEEVKTLFAYLDRLLEALPEDKIDEFGRSEYFELYKKVFKTLKIS
ncbi:MAG: hypothetical protein FD137_2620 [Spirochaetes bacterium]|nr:MAG: hypothetical protein FD137_2620 [Spirochaetota bacterium]